MFTRECLPLFGIHISRLLSLSRVLSAKAKAGIWPARHSLSYLEEVAR